MGRGSPIPPMLRRKIVEQYQKGVSQRKIANSLKLSSSTVHNIIQRFRESGTISVRKGQGRKTILDARDLRALRRHCITYRNATVMEITTWAQEYFQKTLSVNTIHRAIRRCRLKLYRSKKKPYLNMIQKRRHFLWAKAHLKWTVAKWKTVLWSDESKFEVLFGKLGRHVIRTKEDKDNPSCYQRSVQKSASLMVWGCMSAYVMGSLHIWKGTINAERNYNINVSTYQFFVFFLMFQVVHVKVTSTWMAGPKVSHSMTLPLPACLLPIVHPGAMCSPGAAPDTPNPSPSHKVRSSDGSWGGARNVERPVGGARSRARHLGGEREAKARRVGGSEDQGEASGGNEDQGKVRGGSEKQERDKWGEQRTRRQGQRVLRDVHNQAEAPNDVHSRAAEPSDVHSRAAGPSDIHRRAAAPSDVHR
ncbi:hypothetical protein QTP86_004397 [Hemibagrus guttatus]|nr:hypothetical protein QTP86_004397 [Hemibagrus guttatus]